MHLSVLAAPAGDATPHLMSPNALVSLLFLAFVIDYFCVLPAGLRNRLVFCAATAGFMEGFDGSPLDRWTVQKLTNLIQMGLDQADGSRFAAAGARDVLSLLVAGLFVYVVGCMWPTKLLPKKMGQFVTLNFRVSGMFRINPFNWVMAMLLGILADLPSGLIGLCLRFCLYIVDGWMALLPAIIFGAS